ncbi:hypothetical protein Tco_0414206 [Tanacetum coccineum]
MQQPMQNLKNISDPTTAIDMALSLMAKAFTLNDTTPTNNNQRSSSNPSNMHIAQPGMNMDQDKQMLMVEDNVGNQFRLNAVQNVGNQVVLNAVQNLSVQNVGNQNGLSIDPGITNQYGIRNVVTERDEGNGAYDEIEEVTAKCTLKDNLQQASTSGTQTDSAPVYDSDGSAENDSNVISAISSVEQVEKVNSVNRKIKETNADLTTKLARYKNQEKCFEISQEKYDKLERCYQKSVYQEQCLTKMINALHLSSAKTITTLNEEIANLNNRLSKEESTVSFLNEEKKKLKSDFKIREDELLDKQIQLENKIKELDNILVKMGQSIQTMHMLSPKPDSFYHTKQKMALGYQNPFYLKQAQQKQQSLYNGKVLLEKHDPRAVYDSEETLELAQESRLKMKQLNKEIKPANYTKINHLSEVFVSQTAKSREELYFSNTSKTANVSKSISIPNEEFSDDTTPKAAKFVQEFKSLAKEADESLAKHKALELEIERLLRAVVNTLDPLSQKLENENVELEFQVLNYAKENAHLKTTYKNLFDSIKLTRAQTKAIIDSLQDKLHDMIYENAKLRAQLFDKVSEQKDTNKGTSVNTQFSKQSILGKPPSSSKPKLYSVTPFPKSTVIPKVGKSNALSKPVTSNSAPSSRESTVVNNERVIAPGIFRINPFKASRVDNFVPNKHVKASVRTKPITVSQPHVITKKDVNSITNGFSPKNVESTTRTRRPQPRNNPKSDKVPFKSKSSCLSNKLEKIEENHRSLQSSNYPDHTSSECNNIKLAIRNEKSEVICATCKQCLITANHDECVLQYVNGMKSRKKNQSANVSKSANQKKHKANVKKSKKSGSKESLASPSKPRSFLRWLPTGRIFDLCGKITSSSNTESESDTSVCDNASASNPQEPTNKGFPSSTSFLGSQNRRDLPRNTPLDRIENLGQVEWRFHRIPAEPQMSMLVKKCSSQEVSKVISRQKDQDIKFKDKDIKSKIKIQDHKHAEGTPKEFPSLQGSKTQDVTRSKAICAMTTP